MIECVESGHLDHVPGRGAYMPWITPLPDGDFIASQHVGSALGANDCKIEILRSTDGKQWVNEGPIDHHDTAYSYRIPHIHVLADGRLALTATRFACSESALFDPTSEALQRPQMLLYYSGDMGHHWTAPQIVSVDLPAERYTANGAGTLLQLSPDRWMYPFETWKPAGYSGPPDQKAGALLSSDRGQTWDEWVVVADDSSGQLCYWDQMCAQLSDGRIYTMLWVHRYGTDEDAPNHYTLSDDGGRTWSPPQTTNLQGQVCCPIPLADGRVAALYNHRRFPQGIRLALSDDLRTFTDACTVFDAGHEATLGRAQSANFLAEHLLIAFGKPGGIQLDDGNLLVWFWCTVGGVTHTRWARLSLR